MQMIRVAAVWAILAAAALHPALAEPVTVTPTAITEWKAVYGKVEARDMVPARARLGGTLVDLAVTEGDKVAAGQVMARIVDDKIVFQRAALAAQRNSLLAQLANAETDLKRGQDLLQNGSTTVQRVDALQTQVDVLQGQVAALDAQADVLAEQEKEGQVLAPVAGRVLNVPLTQGAVVMPGEAIAVIGGGGTFLRIAVPERHAAALTTGASIRISGPDGEASGILSRVYPLIENGRVVADVEIEGLLDTFVGARMLVRLPVGERTGLLVPATGLITRSGLDFVTLEGPEGGILSTVVPGQHQVIDGTDMVEIISGLRDGDRILPVGGASDE